MQSLFYEFGKRMIWDRLVVNISLQTDINRPVHFALFGRYFQAQKFDVKALRNNETFY